MKGKITSGSGTPEVGQRDGEAFVWKADSSSCKYQEYGFDVVEAETVALNNKTIELGIIIRNS